MGVRRVGFLQGPDGVDRVGFRFASRLDVRQLEVGIRRDGEAYHLQAMLRRNEIRRRLVGRAAGRNEEDRVEPKPGARGLGDEQMAPMDGIERAPVQPELHSRSWPVPSTMNLVLVSSSRPIAPRAWMRVVLMPISAPRPNWWPSWRRVEALTKTAAASTSFRKRMARPWSCVTIASECCEP